MSMENLKLVFVEWEDSAQGHSHWQYLDEIEIPSTIQCQSVGWLINKNDQVIQLANSIGGVSGSQASGIITILGKCIVKIEDLPISSSSLNRST